MMCARRTLLIWSNCISLAFLGVFGLSGCATLFTGSYDNVKVYSEPAGAQVTIDGSYKGTTPITVALRRDQDHNISVHKEGYPDVSRKVSRTFNFVALANTINPVCWGADYVTGGIWKFEETEFNVDLASRTPQSNPKK